MKKSLLFLSAFMAALSLMAQKQLVATINYNWTATENLTYTLSFETDAAKTLSLEIDWGNGQRLGYNLTCKGKYGEDGLASLNLTNPSASAKLSGSSIKIYTENPADIAMLLIDQPYNATQIPQSMDLSALTNLRTLKISKANFGYNLDLSANGELLNLSCTQNGLTALDLTNNLKLKELQASGNYFGDNLNLTKCVELKKLLVVGSVMGSKAVTSLDLSNNAKLEDVTCYLNKIETLDLSKATQLKSLNCHTSMVKDLKLNSSALTYLDCSNNQLTFAQLPIPADIDTYNYNPQANIAIETTYGVGTPIDLSHIGATGYKWISAKNGEVLAPAAYTITNGVTTFSTAIADPVYCEMTTEDFKNLGVYLLKLQTTPTSISTGTSIDESQSSTKVEGQAGAINIIVDSTTKYAVFNTSGSAIANGSANGNTSVSAPQGIYIVKVGESTHKVIVR